MFRSFFWPEHPSPSFSLKCSQLNWHSRAFIIFCTVTLESGEGKDCLDTRFVGKKGSCQNWLSSYSGNNTSSQIYCETVLDLDD